MAKSRKIVAALFLLAGCASGPDIPNDDADFGPPPRNFQDAVLKRLTDDGKIASVASVRFGVPYKAYELQTFLMGGGVAWQGWVVDVSVDDRVFHAEMLGNGVQEIVPDGLFESDLHPLWPSP